MSAQRLRRLAVGATALLLTGGAVAAPAVAAPAAATQYVANSQTIFGDLTGDGIGDRLTLGSIHKQAGDVCAYQLTPGLGRGVYGTPVAHTLPVNDTVPKGGFRFCPDLGVVVKGPTPNLNQLAVAWFQFTPNTGPNVQTFRGFATNSVRYTSGFNGEYQPSVIASQDFDGDGWGDLWEATDQGDGFAAYLGQRGGEWHGLYQTPTNTAGANPQFFDFNHNGGKDVLVTWSILDNTAGVAVVDGKTGAVQVLASTGTDAPSYYQASVVDLNHDNYPDVQVVETTYDGATVVHTYLNQSLAGRWYFAPQSTA